MSPSGICGCGWHLGDTSGSKRRALVCCLYKQIIKFNVMRHKLHNIYKHRILTPSKKFLTAWRTGDTSRSGTLVIFLNNFVCVQPIPKSSYSKTEILWKRWKWTTRSQSRYLLSSSKQSHLFLTLFIINCHNDSNITLSSNFLWHQYTHVDCNRYPTYPRAN